MTAPKKLTIALAGALAALALGSIAWGAIPDDGALIHGCYRKDTGAGRVYDSAAAAPKVCTIKEAPLDWSQQGPSQAYSDSSALVSMVSDTSWPGSHIASRTLPAGSYVFIANTVARPFGLNSPQHNV